MIDGWGLTDMPRKSDPASARARAEALFKPRQEQAAVPTATAESKAPERKSERLHQSKTLGLPRHKSQPDS
jgi:hypothetical protein